MRDLESSKNLRMHCVLFAIKSLELREVDWRRLDLIKNRKVTRRKNRQTLIKEHLSLVTKKCWFFHRKAFVNHRRAHSKAEIIQVLKFVDANYSFASSCDGSERS